MQKGIELKKIDDKNDNIIDFAEEKGKRTPLLALGGGGGEDDNWLGNLEIGTVFLARDNQNPNELQLAKFMVIKHYTVSSHLLLAITKDQMDMYVPTLPFSRRWKFVETLGVVDAVYKDGSTLSGKEYPKEEEENSHGESDRTV